MTEREQTFLFNYGCFPEPKDDAKLYNTRYLTPERNWSKSNDFWDLRDKPKYCPYCGHKLKLYTTDDDKEKYFNCDCGDALYEHDLSERIEKLYKEMPRPKYRMTSDGSVLPIKLRPEFYY